PQLPGVVQPGSPGDGARDVSLQSSLSWSPASNAVSYHVQVSPSSSFAGTAMDRDGIAGTSFPISALANNTAYFWRVRGANSAGFGPWSVVRSFTTVATDTTRVDPPLQPPGVIQVNTPGDGTSGVSLQSSFTWTSAPTAVSYHVQVSPASSFATMSIDQDSVTATSYPIGTLVAGRTYFWRVRGANGAGFGAWSAVRSFTTAAPDTTTQPQQPPAAIQLNSPADGTRDLTLQSSLSWTAVPTAVSYHVQVSLTSSFGSRALDEDSVGNTSFPVATLAGSTTYYWRVRGTNRGGYGPWSASRSFTTAGTTGGSGKEGSQLLQNGDFENGAQGWTFFSNGTGGFSMAGPAFRGSSAGRIAITSPGDNVQLYQSGIELSANTYYRLTFSAYSSTGHDLAVGLMKHGSPYTNYGLLNRTVGLGTGWETHTVYLRTANFAGTVNDARLQFWLPGFAKEGDEYWFDEVSIQQIDLPPSLGTPRVLAPAPGAADQPAWITLCWTRIDGADGYLVQLATDSSFSRLVCDSVVIDTQMVAGPLESATCYYRRVRALNIGGSGSFTQVCSFTTTVAKTGPERTGGLPLEVALEQNYPNPFNPSTVIQYHLPDQAHVTLKVYNALGVEVAVVDEGERSAGIHSVSFAASGLASGTYFYTLRTNGLIETKKMMLLH
ncbi:MAG TPA: T9SS type A sorting domain-containing protein, partial [Bacteroidota bacterium]|nr:T9SS type A sorting domain-containing protein [Bacteroidota bacterium]